MSAGPASEADPAVRKGGMGSLRVGDWLVLPGSNELYRDGVTTRIESKAMEVLAMLARHAGEVVGREELLNSVWSGTSVGDDALTQAVIKLRKALGDETRTPAYIETIPKRGYRLIAAVDWSSADSVALTGFATATVALGRSSSMLRWVLAAVAIIVIGGFLLWLGAGSREAPRRAETETVTREPVRLAVLPFENLGDNPSQEYFNNGITADLITDLSKISGIRVIAHSSSVGYRRTNIQPSKIAHELDVRYLLSGHVQKEGGRVRINVQLLDATGGQYLWAERYDRELSSLFELQDEIRGKIVTSLAVSLPVGDATSSKQKYAASIEAYDLFLRGMDHLGRRGLDDVRTARAFFQQAVALDPGFARAYASMAVTYARDAMDGWAAEGLQSLEEAGRLADQAQALDERLPQVHFVQALVRLFQRDHGSAARAAEKAIALQPSYADAYAVLAWILHFAGQNTQALEPLGQAMRLNPRTPAAYLLTQGEILLSAGKHAQAIAALERAALQSATHPRVLLMLTAAYAFAGQQANADWKLNELQLLHPDVSIARLRWALPFRDRAESEKLLDALRRAGLREDGTD